jgi:hypothetical protein
MMEDFVSGMAGWEGDSAIVLAEPIEQLSNALRDLDPSTQRALGNAASASGRPEATGINGNVGARFAVESTGIDGALVVASLRSPIPLTRLSSRYRSMLQSETLPSFDALGELGAEAPLSSAWPRTWMTGAEVSTVLGPVGLRAEGAWWSNKVHQQTWLDATTRSTTAGGLGLDYASGSWLFVGIEGRWQHMMHPIKRPFLTQTDVFEIGATTRLSLAGDRLLISAATVVNPTFSEGLARPEIRWVSSDTLSFGIGAILLYGEVPPPADLADALTYAGGPISMMSENDAVFFTLRWSH